MSALLCSHCHQPVFLLPRCGSKYCSHCPLKALHEEPADHRAQLDANGLDLGVAPQPKEDAP